MTVRIEDKVKWIRKELFEMFLRAKQGHPGSVLSLIDIISVMYYGKILNYKKGVPIDPNRDKVIVSKGHATMGLYPILADIGFFPKEELKLYGSGKGILRIFGNISIPGIDATTGSLGHGQGIGAGFAYSAKKDKNSSKTYVIISEGEMYEGSVWETALFAAHQQLDNLIIIIDRNRKMILGDTEDCIKLNPIDKKWESFGWETHTVDGHSIQELISVFNKVQNNNAKPKIIIANTIKGKGASIMEHKAEWHYWQGLTEEEIELTRKELMEVQ